MFFKEFAKIIAVVIFAAYIFNTGVIKVSAHAVDTAELYFYYNADLDKSAIPENIARIYVYINWFQADALVQKATGQGSKDYEELLKFTDIYKEYMLKNLRIYNNDQICEPNVIELTMSESPFLLDVGPRQVFDFVCKDKLSNIKIKNTLLLDVYEYQTNFVSLSIGDKIIDELEMNRYFTESNIAVTADNLLAGKPHDFVSTNGTLSPDDPGYANQNFQNLAESSASNQVTENVFTKAHKIIGNYWDSALKYIKPGNVGTFKDKSLISILGVVFLLGLLHTLEAGHSKMVLASAMVHKNMNLKRGIMYALVFTVTHIGDILAVGLLFMLINNFIDIYEKFNTLEQFATYSLFFIALYMLFRNVSEYIENATHKKQHENGSVHNHDGDDHTHLHGRHSHTHEIDDSHSFKQQLLVGFLSGLAPCVFGWSIFMLILSTRSIWILIPVIISFGAGIFAALIFVAFLAVGFKKSAYSRFTFLTEISPILSALILLMYAIFVLI